MPGKSFKRQKAKGSHLSPSDNKGAKFYLMDLHKETAGGFLNIETLNLLKCYTNKGRK